MSVTRDQLWKIPMFQRYLAAALLLHALEKEASSKWKFIGLLRCFVCVLGTEKTHPKKLLLFNVIPP